MKKTLFLLLLLIPGLVQAQASRSVPITDPAYRDIDLLISHGLITDFIIGQRPYSRLDMARMISQAQDRSGALCETTKNEKSCAARKEYVDSVLQSLSGTFVDEISFLKKGHYDHKVKVRILDQVQAGLMFLDSPQRALRSNSSLSRIDGLHNPLVQNRDGRHYVDGSQYSWETLHWARLTPYALIEAAPRFEGLFPTGIDEDDSNILAQRLYAKLGYSNVELEVGRDGLIWGQGEYGGTLISNNARPLDMIKLSNDRPLRFPWIFKHLGNFKSTFFVANLGPEQFFENSFFTGLKLSLQPFKFLELGLSQGIVMGGDGAPSLDIGSVFSEFFASRGSFLSTAGIQDENLSNRIYGGEIRLTVPPLRNALFYLEMNSDDAFFSRFTTNWGYIGGIYVPRLDNKGKWNLRVEAKRFPSIFYGHSGFRSGWTLNRRIIGDPLGPDGSSVMAKIGYRLSPKAFLSLTATYADHDSNRYKKATGSGDYYLVQDNPAEQRLTFKLDSTYAVNSMISVGGGVGYERVNGFNFTSGANRDNVAVEGWININPDWFRGSK